MYSLFIVIIKYIIEKYYISPLKISLLFGIIALFINCIGYIVYSLIKFQDLSYFKDLFDFSKGENIIEIIIYIILLFIFGTALQLFTLLALFYFSPTLIMITDIISPLLLWTITTIINGKSVMPEVVLNPIGYIIVLFSALIYNEIIIFNFCGFNKDTKKFINQRLDVELKKLKENEDMLLADNYEIGNNYNHLF